MVFVSSFLLLAGCVPEPVRIPTQVKSAGDVKITVGAGEVVEEQAEPAAGSSSSSTTTAASASPPATASTAPSAGSAAQASGSPGNSPAAAAAPQSTDGPAKFIGRVVVKGTPPKLPPLLAKGAPSRDAICSEQQIPNQSVVVGPSGGLANVIVYMKRTPDSGVPEPSGDAVVLDQKGCTFLPHVAVCRSGQSIKLLNSDPVAHNVKIIGLNAQFNQTVQPNDPAGIDYTFNLPERVPAEIRCDFHGWMSAYALPLDHPWAAVTDENGNFEIQNLPDGEWEFVVWHEVPGYLERSVKIKAQKGQVVQKTFEVDASELTK